MGRFGVGAVVLLLGVLVLAGAVSADAGRAEEPTVTITLKDHEFVPADVEVPAGVKVKLLVRNDSSATAEFESPALHREKVVKAGGEVSLSVGPLAPGSYEFFDDFHRETKGHLTAK